MLDTPHSDEDRENDEIIGGIAKSWYVCMRDLLDRYT
jgi:hypothetical protein